MKSEDYIFGVVSAEMPALYETEALKAQAVAAYTYACFNRKNNADKEYDISTENPTKTELVKSMAKIKEVFEADGYKNVNV